MKTWIARALALGGLLAAFAPPAAAEEPKVGDKAPDFELKATDGKTYKLADFKGKQPVVLAWFPKADTPGCTLECKSFKAGGENLRKLKVAYFTASVDSTADNKKFSDKFDFDFPILSDPEKTVAKEYGVLNARGMANRWTFYIDKEGVIKEIDKKITSPKAAEDVAEKVKSLGLAAE